MDSGKNQKALVERAFWSSYVVKTAVVIVFRTVTF